MKSTSPYSGRPFAGVTEAAIIKRIAYRAYRMHLPRSDIEDVRQEVFNALSKATFDPQRTDGASPLTFISTIIDHKILCHKRANGRRERRCATMNMTDDMHTSDPFDPEDAEGLSDASNSGSPLLAPSQPVDLQIDMKDALAALSERERRVCISLSEGRSITEIAALLNCGRDTVGRLIQRIRTRFAELGMDAWTHSHQHRSGGDRP